MIIINDQTRRKVKSCHGQRRKNAIRHDIATLGQILIGLSISWLLCTVERSCCAFAVRPSYQHNKFRRVRDEQSKSIFFPCSAFGSIPYGQPPTRGEKVGAGCTSKKAFKGPSICNARSALNSERSFHRSVKEKKLCNSLSLPCALELDELSNEIQKGGKFGKREGQAQLDLEMSSKSEEKRGSEKKSVITEFLERETEEQAGKLIVRHLEESDLPSVLRMCLAEYGSSPSYDDASFFPWKFTENGAVGKSTQFLSECNSSEKDHSLSNLVENLSSNLENFLFELTIGIGMRQRIGRRKQCDEVQGIKPDHNVLCLEHVEEGGRCGEIVGIVEISLQPPFRTGSAFVLPIALKHLTALLERVRYGIAWNKISFGLEPYVSNLLIKESRRGKGYSKILMMACEGRAKAMGFEKLTLHVDANPRSGKIPQKLYKELGYEPIFVDTPLKKLYSWVNSGNDMHGCTMSSGVHFVDGVPLLYLGKKIV